LPRWLIIGVVALIILEIILVNKPWESQQYKDCVRANQTNVNGTAITQSGIEQYCHQLYG
jgi:hypothetical protein